MTLPYTPSADARRARRGGRRLLPESLDGHTGRLLFPSQPGRAGLRGNRTGARAACELNVGDARLLPDSRADRRDLAVKGAADDGKPGSVSGSVRPSSAWRRAFCSGRVGKLHHVGVALRGADRGRASDSRRARRSHPFRAPTHEPVCSRSPCRRARPGRSAVDTRHRARRPPRVAKTFDPLDDGGYVGRA